MVKEHTYFTKGMHCASCEVLIEKKLLEVPGVRSVEASTNNGKVTVEYEGEKPSISILNDIFKKDHYTFFENQYKATEMAAQIHQNKPANATLVAFNIAIFIVIAFLLLDRVGVTGLVNVTSASSLWAFFGFGLLAGLSSCAALIGGIVLSMSKQWQEIYANESSRYKRFQPHLMFNIGRILSYTLFRVYRVQAGHIIRVYLIFGNRDFFVDGGFGLANAGRERIFALPIFYAQIYYQKNCK